MSYSRRYFSAELYIFDAANQPVFYGKGGRSKAQEARIKSLEQKLSDSVPKNEYESLQKKYEELQVKYSQMKKGTLLKMYDQL